MSSAANSHNWLRRLLRQQPSAQHEFVRGQGGGGVITEPDAEGDGHRNEHLPYGVVESFEVAGELYRLAGLSYDDYVLPRGAEPGDAPRFTPPGGPGHFANIDVRLDPDSVPFGGGDEARIAAWLRPLDGDSIDAAWLVAMCDILPPAVFTGTTSPVKAAMIEYAVHLASGQPCVPAGEHVYLSCHSPLSSEGFAVEDATMWAPDGSVLAVARQTRLAGT